MDQEMVVKFQREPQKLWNGHYSILLLVSLLVSTANFMLMALLPLHMIILGGNYLSAGLLTMVYTLSALVFRPMFGKLVDTKGRRLVLMIGLAAFSLATALLVVTENLQVVYILRFFHGIGLSGFTTAMGTILSDVVPKSRLAEGVGYFGISGTLASAIGPVVALFFIKQVGYELSYIITFSIIIISLLVGLQLNYEKKRNHELGQTSESDHEKESATKTKLFSFIEKSSLRTCLVVFFVIFPVSAIFSFMPLFALERNIDNIGLFFTTYSLTMIGVRVLGGKLVDRYGHFYVYMPSIIILLLTFFTLIFAWNLPLVLLAGVFFGIGFGFVQPIFNTLILQLSPSDRIGAANATYYATMDIAFGLGAFAWGALSDAFGFGSVFIGSTVMIGLSIIVYFTVLHTKLSHQPN